jgi:chromosome segregation ATPase
MSNRLSSLVSRHQREIKILTAARTLQKLNNNNKRMSKQTMESLEQSEKRVDAAEKEVLVLREREAGLRKQLMEHWSGVMAWEVRRLEKVSAESQARYARQERQANMLKDREDAMRRQFAEIEQELQDKSGRVIELQEVVDEMRQRERVMQDEVRQLDEEREIMERERSAGSKDKQAFQQERSEWDRERRAFEAEKRQWESEKRALLEERDNASRDRQKSLESGQMSDRDRATMDRLRSGLGAILGRKSGNVGETEMVEAIEEVKTLVQRREKEVCTLRDEMREVNNGLEEEVRRVRADRDAWQGKVERAEEKKKEELGQLEKRSRVSYIRSREPKADCIATPGPDVRLKPTQRIPLFFPQGRTDRSTINFDIIKGDSLASRSGRSSHQRTAINRVTVRFGLLPPATSPETTCGRPARSQWTKQQRSRLAKSITQLPSIATTVYTDQ